MSSETIQPEKMTREQFLKLLAILQEKGKNGIREGDKLYVYEVELVSTKVGKISFLSEGKKT